MTNTYLYQLLFVATGVISTISSQIVYYHGAGAKESLLPVIANILGVTLILIFRNDQESEKETSSSNKWDHTFSYLRVAILDLLGNVFTIIGLTYVGSGLFQVLYSSNVLFSGLFSKFFLRKEINRYQWLGLFIISTGLMLSTLGSNISQEYQSNLFFGVILTFLGTIFYSLSYISSESILNSANPPLPEDLQGYSGFYSLSISFVYFFIYTLPRWKELVTLNIIKNSGNINVIILTYCIIIASGFLHSLTYFKLVKSIGAVSTGVMQSIRAIVVFVLSSLLFCSTYENQCYNNQKLFGTFIVISGLLIYSKYTNNESESSLHVEDKLIA